MESESDPVLSVDRAAVLLEHCARREGLSFDRVLARRTLHESMQAIRGSGPEVWAKRLIECGESLDLRIQYLECTLGDAIDLVSGGHVVAAAKKLPEGGFAWLLVDGYRGRRLHVLDTGDGSRQWMSWRQFGRLVGIAGHHSTARFVYGQRPLIDGSAAVPGTASTRNGGRRDGRRAGDGSAGLRRTPLRRLMAILRSELPDIWAILVFSAVVGLLTLTTPIAVEALVNTVAFGRFLQPVFVLSLIVMAFLAFSGAMTALIAIVVELLQRRIFVRVVQDLSYRIPRVEQSAVDGLHLPEEMNRFFDVMHIQSSAPKLLVEALSAILQTLIGMAVLAFYHPFLLGFDIILLVLLGAGLFLLGRGAERTAIGESICKYATAGWLEEIARHPTAFRLNGGSHFAFERADKLAIDYLDARRAHFRIVMRQFCFILGIYVLASTALLGLGGWLVIAGELTLGQLVAAELIVTLILGSFVKVANQLEVFYDLLASVDKVGNLLDLPIESHDRLFHLPEDGSGRLVFQNVTAGIGGVTVLSGFSLEVLQGECVAVLGPHGSGKSVLVDLVCGLRHPSIGSILLDGIDLRELRPDALRDQVGVSRGVEVFSGTIDENVHLGRPSIRASETREALKAVGLDEQLAALSMGSNTELLTDGAPLSRGSAQKLMVARAMVGNVRLLLIDSSLDLLPFEEARAIIGRLKAARTRPVLVMTTRPEIAGFCDRQITIGDSGNLAVPG